MQGGDRGDALARAADILFGRESVTDLVETLSNDGLADGEVRSGSCGVAQSAKAVNPSGTKALAAAWECRLSESNR
jgi:hypothetical protein